MSLAHGIGALSPVCIGNQEDVASFLSSRPPKTRQKSGTLAVFAAMNRYDKMKIELLGGAKTAHDYLPIRVHELALKYGIDQRHVCEKLVEFHAEKLIRLSAWDDNEGRDKPFNEWPDAPAFFACRWDSNYKRVQLLVRGSEFLENLAPSELPSDGEHHNEGWNRVPVAGRMQPTPSEEVDWKRLTPESLIDAVNHVRGRFEEEEFKFGFVTQQKCYKELHPVAAMEMAPAVFKYHMDVYEAGLKRATEKAFGDLFEIGLANAQILSQGPIEWSKSHLEFLILGKEYKIKIWIKNVCDRQEMSKSTTPEEMEEFIHWRTWRAPRLIVMQPSANVPYDPASTWSRENEEQTEKFLSALSERFVQGLGFHLDRIAGEAHVKLAKQGRPFKRPVQELSVKVESAEHTDPNNPTPVAFISYSWDSDAHKQWVLDLATKLQAHGGVQIVLDRWHLPPGDDRTVFMEKSVVTSKFVILVCTPAYAVKANNREGGVGYEATIITAELAENINQRKFIPVLRDGDWKLSLPVWIKTKVGVDLRNDPYPEEQYQNLLRALHDAPLKPPPVGPKPVFRDVSGYQKSLPLSKPLVVPLRYGPSPIHAGKHTMGHHGLIVANHGEPAYDVSVSTAKIPIGTSELRFEGSKPVFTKADGEAFFIGTIELAPHYGTLGSGLFEEMRKFHVDEITVKLIYKDAENRWYETIGKIERDVSVAGGLTVRYVRQERTKQP